MVVEINGAIVCLSVFDPLCDDLLEFDEARMLVVPYEVSHLFEEGDAFFEALLFRLFGLRHLFLDRWILFFFRWPPLALEKDAPVPVPAAPTPAPAAAAAASSAITTGLLALPDGCLNSNSVGSEGPSRCGALTPIR